MKSKKSSLDYTIKRDCNTKLKTDPQTSNTKQSQSTQTEYMKVKLTGKTRKAPKISKLELTHLISKTASVEQPANDSQSRNLRRQNWNTKDKYFKKKKTEI